MSTKKRGLGRGLDALLGTSAGAPVTPAADASAGGTDTDLRALPVDIIDRSRYQPRHDFDEVALQELADSIKAQGVVQPIVVRPGASGRFELIAGERRWRATQIAGLHEIPAVVRDVPDRAAMAMALIENIQREDLNPMDEALALQRLIDEFGLTHQQAAEAVGRSRAAVSNLLRLLTLNSEVKQLVATRQLEMGHARALLGLEGEVQLHAARQVVHKGLSARETEALVRKMLHTPEKKAAANIDPDIRRLQDQLSEQLGARVQLQHARTGKGKVVIAYNSLDELDGILAHIK
ncbi:MAG: ParB/RepB/Spo0J family partition protein [Pseudomonadota bacterium]|nr:MAG: ParB/RepB/Spo0J family partition protein [Pseudomonadota bacterium]